MHRFSAGDAVVEEELEAIYRNYIVHGSSKPQMNGELVPNPRRWSFSFAFGSVYPFRISDSFYPIIFKPSFAKCRQQDT